MQASQKDCGVYRCVISNEYGTDSTDFLLSPEGEVPSAAWWLLHLCDCAIGSEAG